MESHLIEKSKKLFESTIKTETIRNHCIEVSAILSELAKSLDEDEEKWAAAGLVHDLDYEEVKDLENHARKTVEILQNENFPADLIHAVASHNPVATGVSKETRLDYALSAADNVSGLIYAYGLMKKTLEGIEPSSVRKKMKDKRFAAAVNRDAIGDIEKAGISLDKFLEISIKAMQGIKDKIGF